MSRLAWAGIGGLVVFGVACGGRTLAPPPDAALVPGPDAIVGARDTGGGDTGGAGADAIVGARDAGGAGPDAIAGARDAGGIPFDAGADRTTCPTGSTGSPPADTPALPPSSFVRQPATQVPFACDPLPAAFFFPAPGGDVPGAYSRYASYEVGDASSVSASPDVRLAALATRDGIVRVVELASSRVVGVLARPRASLDLVAFSPSGELLLTVARGEREATLWRTSTFAPLWTTTLPGHTYDNASLDDVGFTPGGVAFSPDGASAVVSPGRGLFRLDVTTGAVLAQASLVVSDVGYGWGGRRVVATVPSLAAHCQHRAHGGQVIAYDPASLAQLTVVADWGYYPMVTGQPAFRAAALIDYVIVPGTTDAPAPRAFRLSDGAALPAPAVATLPLSLVRGGDKALVIAEGELRIVFLASGEIVARAPAPPDGDPLAVSVSQYGTSVVLGGRGAGLLRAWTPFPQATPNPAQASDLLRPVCSTDARPSSSESTRSRPAASLSASGSVLALGWGGEVRILDPADGRRLRTFAGSASDTNGVQLSPDGRYVLVRPWDYPMATSVVYRVDDGVLVTQLAPSTTYWGAAVFSPDDRELLVSGFALGTNTLAIFDLVAGAPPRTSPIAAYGSLLGFSGGCLVVQDQVLGIFRSCARCDDTPFAPKSWAARLSPDGRLVAALDGRDEGSSLTLYRMPPDLGVVRTFPPRAAEHAWGAVEIPVAVTNDRSRVLLGAEPSYSSCYMGPEFEIHVHDARSGVLFDALPPGLSAVDADAKTLAYGAQIWRAR